MMNDHVRTPAKMRLRYSALSPFARKVLVAAHETGTFDRLELVPADVWAADSDITTDNPLGKIPSLLAPEGLLPGSGLICEYLEELAGGGILVPRERQARWAVLSAYGVADGLMEAAVAHVVERVRRPVPAQWPGWLQRQEDKINRALARLEAMPAASRQDVSLFTVTLGCALGYLDRRLPDLGWRNRHLQLATWLDTFALRPSMEATRPPSA